MPVRNMRSAQGVKKYGRGTNMGKAFFNYYYLSLFKKESFLSTKLQSMCCEVLVYVELNSSLTVL